MSEKTREELFKEAQEKVRKEQEEALKKKNQKRSTFEKNYEDLTYSGLETNKDMIFRIYGDPLVIDESRKSKDSAHKVFRAHILCDDNKKRYFNFPDFNDDPNYILHRIYRLITKVEWDNTTRDKDGKGKKIFVNEKTHPELFNRVTRNNDFKNPYEKGWYPTLHVVTQGIDRQQMQWHKEHKSMRLLSKKIGYLTADDGKVLEFPEYGITMSLYNSIWNTVVEYYGSYSSYDLCIRKKVVVNNGKDEYIYEVFNATVEINKIKDENIKKLISSSPSFTEEELSWHRYDIRRLCQPASNSKILRNLGNFIKSVDAAFKTNFYDELVILAQNERDSFKEESETQKEIEEDVRKIVVETSTPPKDVKFNLADYYEKFPSLEKLSDEEKKLIIGWNGEDFIYNSENLADCPQCKYSQPIEIESFCIGCGAEFVS